MHSYKKNDIKRITDELTKAVATISENSTQLRSLAEEFATARTAQLADRQADARDAILRDIDVTHLQNGLALTLEYHKKMQSIGTGIMQACVFGNTGALVVLPGLVKDTFGMEIPLSRTDILNGARLFTFGLCIGLLGALVAYFASRHGTMRAVFEAIRCNVERSAGFLGELRRFSPETPVGARIFTPVLLTPTVNDENLQHMALLRPALPTTYASHVPIRAPRGSSTSR